MQASNLAFQGTSFDVVDQASQPWLRANQIGLALEYRNPELSIAKLYRANAAEFTDSMTAVVKLPTAGGMQDVRIFSLRGAHLLGMFARTARAAEFRRWVLDVLDSQATAPALSYHVAKDQTLSAEQAQTLRSLLQDFAQSMPRDLQAQIMVQGWSKLKAHFHVDYRHIPAAQFTEAVNILSRHIAQWAPADPKKTEPQPPSLAGRRWLVWFDHRGQEQHMAVPNDAFAMSLNDLPAFLLDAGTHPRPDQLAAIASACVTRLAQVPQAQPPALAT